MQIKYIADLHLYDLYSLDWRTDFRTLDEYAQTLTECWNDFTSDDDIVIIVGDIGTYCPKTLATIAKLRGRKVLVKGNHDVDWGDKVYTCGLFQGIHENIYSNGVYVNHIPERPDFECQYFIHGHHHRYDVPGMQQKLVEYSCDTYRLNCAADLIDNHPNSITELILNKEVLLDDYRVLGYL